jgi:hypothetical protein
MERTYSQNVARAFEIADYILLIPAILGAVLATLIPSILTLLVYGFFIAGVVLLVGYFKHSRGQLDESNFSALWIASAVYNGVLLLPCLYFASTLLQSGILDNEYSDGGSVVYFLFILSVVSGYFAAVIFSLRAYFFEKRKKYIDRQISLKNMST